MATGRLISIIDDDPSQRAALAGFVRSLGYDVRAFPSAEDFLESGELGQLACVITDIHMPGMNGFELTQELNLKFDSIPVIMITARTESSLEERAMSNGATFFLRKPIEADVLVCCIEKVLGE